MKKILKASIPLILTSGCTLDIHIFDHREGSPITPPAIKGQFAELYFDSDPSLATIRVISDGLDNSLDINIGSTPHTVRIANNNTAPLNSSICGRTIIVLFEREKYITEKVATKIKCYLSEQQSEFNPNLITTKLHLN